MELRHLRSFVAVAEELHFGRAARRLHISQPPLSQHIVALERDVGAPLLRRTSRRVELTEAGQRLLEGAREILAMARQARELARRANTGQIGWLQVGFVPACAMIPPVVRRFARRFPDVHLALRCMPSVDQLACVREGRLDVGFVHLPIDVPHLECELVQESVVVVALPTGHRLASQARVAWGSLADERFIGFPRSSAPAAYDMIHSRLRAAGFFPRIVHEADSLLARLRMVGAGVGVALVSAYAATLPRPGVVLRPLRPPRLTAAIGMVHFGPRRTAALDHFLAATREAVKARGRT